MPYAGPAVASTETTPAPDVVVPPVETPAVVADPPADMPKVSSMVAKVEDAIEGSAVAADTTMPKVEAPAVDTPVVDTPSAETPVVEVPAVEVKAPEVPSAGELSADVGAKVDDVSADVSAKVDDVVAKAPDMPSAEVRGYFGPVLFRRILRYVLSFCQGIHRVVSFRRGWSVVERGGRLRVVAVDAVHDSERFFVPLVW